MWLSLGVAATILRSCCSFLLISNVGCDCDSGWYMRLSSLGNAVSSNQLALPVHTSVLFLLFCRLWLTISCRQARHDISIIAYSTEIHGRVRRHYIISLTSLAWIVAGHGGGRRSFYFHLRLTWWVLAPFLLVLVRVANDLLCLG